MAFDDCKMNPIPGCPGYEKAPATPAKKAEAAKPVADVATGYVEGTKGLPQKFTWCDILLGKIYCTKD